MSFCLATVNFLEDKPNAKGVGYRWMFDIDYLTDSMNYIPVSLENQANPHAGASEVTNSASTLQTPSSDNAPLSYLYVQGTTPAEVQAVETGGEWCRGATTYVNMEPGDCHGEFTAVSSFIKDALNSCLVVNAPSLYRSASRVPFSVLKYAMTVDGKIAAST
ncbi:hypothetical protein Tco_1392029 [Tanacetum coccineum]